MVKAKRVETTEEIAIKVENVSKTFRIPHEKSSSLKSAVLNSFRRKTYTEFEAANDISFEVKRGEFLGIIGRNGSGKSTLLKMLAGIYTPTKGKIVINGKLSPFLELGVGFNPELNARENVYLGGAVLGLSRKEIDEKFDEIIRFAELEEFVDMKFKNFSSGMQVRLAFALSINAHAEILLMDEVLAVGDNNFQAKCLEEFVKYKRQGKTVVLVSHDVGTIQKYCDRAILLRKGRVELIGNANAVGDRYIKENMEDEEKKSKSTPNEKLPKSKVIKKVELLDEENQKIVSLMTGGNVRLAVSYDVGSYVGPINIGIGLHSDSGGYIFGYNTQMDKHEINERSGTVSLDFDNFPLLQGNYYINAVCFGEVEAKPLDYKPKVLSFTVRTSGLPRSYRGAVSIKHKWKLK